MRTFRLGASGLLCCVVVAVLVPAAASALPQAASETPAALNRIKTRLDQAPARPLAPKEPVRLRPTYRSRAADRPFVPTLEEHLQKTFELTEFQRKYAEYSARCCGLSLGALFDHIDRALDERRTRKTREQIARELAELEAARSQVR